jgi:hypothetical protein
LLNCKFVLRGGFARHAAHCSYTGPRRPTVPSRSKSPFISISRRGHLRGGGLECGGNNGPMPPGLVAAIRAVGHAHYAACRAGQNEHVRELASASALGMRALGGFAVTVHRVLETPAEAILGKTGPLCRGATVWTSSGLCRPPLPGRPKASTSLSICKTERAASFLSVGKQLARGGFDAGASYHVRLGAPRPWH